MEKRTFARNFSQAMVRTDAFIRSRSLSDHQVAQINYILKARARQYIAAGQEEWLYPETMVTEQWADLREALLPQDGLFQFGGEVLAKFEDGHVHYQDEFGRTEKPNEFLLKKPPECIRPGTSCGCGSGERYQHCCKRKAPELRASWTERSIRERNLFLFRTIEKVLGLDRGKDWVAIRRDLTDEQIKEIYRCYASLWPLETDLLSLLPKPDGAARAVYTGSIHPFAITEYALGASLYFGELIIQTPFVNARRMRKEYSPVENPKSYRHDFLKTVLFFLQVMPLVEVGLVNLIPDPCDFDVHLHDQMMFMAKERAADINLDPDLDPRLKALMEEDYRRSLSCMPADMLRAKIREQSPELDEAALAAAINYIQELKEQDPLADLTTGAFDGGKKGGQFNMMKLAPNFEIAMYLAQATGACIVTDSRIRWEEVWRAIRIPLEGAASSLGMLAASISNADFLFPMESLAICQRSFNGSMSGYPAIMRRTFRYLVGIEARGLKPNVEAQLKADFERVHKRTQAALQKADMAANRGKMACVFPGAGIQDNNVNRLLLMSSSEHHLQSVPMAFLIR